MPSRRRSSRPNAPSTSQKPSSSATPTLSNSAQVERVRASSSSGAGNSPGSPSFPSASHSGPDLGATEEEVQQYVSLIVRGKNSAEHDPALMAQHADVILASGAPAGFFGEGGGRSGAVGMGMDGVVADSDWFEGNRPGYVDGGVAAAQNMSSTVLQIPVTSEQAEAFDAYWAELAKDPGAFSILGDNCSTHAAEAFEAAGLIGGGIRGLDTPNNLYEQLAERYPEAASDSGFLDFDKADDGSWSHSISHNAAPVAAPHGGMDGSSGQSALRTGETTAPSSGHSSRGSGGSL